MSDDEVRELHEMTTIITSKASKASDHAYDINVFTATDHQLAKVLADLRQIETYIQYCRESIEKIREEEDIDPDELEETVEHNLKRRKNTI